MRFNSICIACRSLRSSAASGSLLLTAGQLTRATVGLALQLDQFEHLADPLPDLPLVDPLALQPERDILMYRHVREQRI
jgi:hypothetical protein